MKVKVIGGGLAGVEACYALLKAGYSVDLYEMRPKVNTPAHKTDRLCELVCSNSLKSEDVNTAQGLLKAEMRLLNSLTLQCAEEARVPAGGALAVDRTAFSANVEKKLYEFSRFNVIREEVTEITPNTIIATGPLTSDGLAKELTQFSGKESLHFYDAVAPIVTAESVDMNKAFYGARYGKGSPDYLNCPMNREEYYSFVDALVTADKVILKDFEKGDVFECCMPVEVMASRGVDTLRFGPLRPVGIRDASGNRAYAVVQLRKEDNYDHLLNLVGFQTNLTFSEQKRVFSMIPALKNAEFTRYGVMHRNTFLESPKLLTPYFSIKNTDNTYLAGQITGVEGYLESAASGILAGINLGNALKGKERILLPETTMIGSLSRYVSEYVGNFQPMHASFSLVPQLTESVKKSERKAAYSERAIKDLNVYIKSLDY